MEQPTFVRGPTAEELRVKIGNLIPGGGAMAAAEGPSSRGPIREQGGQVSSLGTQSPTGYS